jgi:tetraacyldisaccharide 4'-kinase
MANWLQKEWATRSPWQLLLLPFSWLFLALIIIRRLFYRLGIFKTTTFSVPVIIVGNINIGGTGKTPVVIWLVEQLRFQGFNPGVISRGYTTSKTQHQLPQEVIATSSPHVVGDEPVLLANRLECPIFVCKKRVLAAKALLENYPACDVLISDDGLQHYALARQFEIVVVDADKAFGNQRVLPAGPLRESIFRLKSASAILVNGAQTQALKGFLHKNLTVFHRHIATEKIVDKIYAMQLSANLFYKLNHPQQQVTADFFTQRKVIAIAGIGNPARFFNQLKSMNIDFSSQAYADHHPFTRDDIAKLDADIILMTEKDAVKCRDFADVRCWVLPVDATIASGLLSTLMLRLKQHDQHIIKD